MVFIICFFIFCLSSSLWFLMNNLWMFSVKYILRLAAVEMNATKVVFITTSERSLGDGFTICARVCLFQLNAILSEYCGCVKTIWITIQRIFSALIAMAVSVIFRGGIEKDKRVTQALPYQSVRIKTIKDKLLHAFTSFSSKFVLFQSNFIHFERIPDNNAPVAHVENETRERKLKWVGAKIQRCRKMYEFQCERGANEKPPSNKSMLFLAAAKYFSTEGFITWHPYAMYSETKRDHE